jgi:hypothetical protein
MPGGGELKGPRPNLGCSAIEAEEERRIHIRYILYVE